MGGKTVDSTPSVDPIVDVIAGFDIELTREMESLKRGRFGLVKVLSVFTLRYRLEAESRDRNRNRDRNWIEIRFES